MRSTRFFITSLRRAVNSTHPLPVTPITCASGMPVSPPITLPMPIASPNAVSAHLISSRQFSSERGVLALIDAVQRKDHVAIDRIARHTPRMIVEQTSNDNTALHEAARIGDVPMIEKLAKAFSSDFNVNHKCHCYKRRTPLAYAVEGGHIAAVNKLFALGADANITDENGLTALDAAILGFKSGINKIAFEHIMLTIKQHGGVAKIHSKEAVTILKELETSLAVYRFFTEYKASTREKIVVRQQQFLDERKKITSGKS